MELNRSSQKSNPSRDEELILGKLNADRITIAQVVTRTQLTIDRVLTAIKDLHGKGYVEYSSDGFSLFIAKTRAN